MFVLPVRAISFFPFARYALVYRAEGDLSEGNTFTVQTPGEKTDWDVEIVEVIGETTVNGVSATEFTVTPDGDEFAQKTMIALADDYPFAVSLEIEPDGARLLEMVLTDSSRP